MHECALVVDPGANTSGGGAGGGSNTFQFYKAFPCMPSLFSNAATTRPEHQECLLKQVQ